MPASISQDTWNAYKVPFSHAEQALFDDLMNKRQRDKVALKGSAHTSSEEDEHFRGLNRQIVHCLDGRPLTPDIICHVMRQETALLVQSLSQIIEAQCGPQELHVAQREGRPEVCAISDNDTENVKADTSFLSSTKIGRKISM